MFSYSTGYYVSPPVDQYLKFKNRCSLLHNLESIPPAHPQSQHTMLLKLIQVGYSTLNEPSVPALCTPLTQ
jgi:hypothetical protein